MSAPGDRILGSYRLIERIGKGGMGEVYRAQHTKLGSERAVKVLPANLATEADFLKRFEREASSAAKLDHPNILAVYDYGEAEGAPYLVMPYIKGGTLKDVMGHGPLPYPDMLRYLQQMADALDYAHAQGLVHRDVKPANMLLDERGRLYLADFGIAKALEGAEGITRTGVGVGTPEYMAPEQAQGRADERSDLYALGIILYQMLTGRVPFTGNSTVEVLMKHLQDPLPMMPLRALNPPLPPRVEQIVQKALAKNPNDRYASGRAFVEDLQEALSGAPTRPVTAIGMAPPPLGNTPPPGAGTPPPYNPSTQQTVAGGMTPVGFGQAPGTTPPPYGGQPPAYGAAGNVTPQMAPAFAATPPAKSSNRGILFGVLGGVGVLLLLCIGGVIALAARGGSNNTKSTQTAQAGVGSTASVLAAANLIATQTAGAPTATKPAAPTVAPTVAVVPTAAPSTVPTPVPNVQPTPAPGQLPTATATRAAVAPTVALTRPPATVAPSAAPRPLGTIPAGWKVYTGPAQLPFVMAYPPDWHVDVSDLKNNRIYFRPAGADSDIWVLIGTTGRAEPNANIDTLRDRYYNDTLTECNKKAIDKTNTVVYSGITFAGLGATCDTTSGLNYSRIGVGLKEQVPWRYRFNAPYGDYDDQLDKYFFPMLSSLNIFANP